MAENSLVRHLNDNISYLETLLANQKNEPYFYFKVKLIINKNNSLTLADKVIGISKNHMFVFWAEESQSQKLQALNNSRKQGINFDKLQFPQQKIPLTKFDQFSLIPNTDSQFVPYLKSVIPSFPTQQNPNIYESYSLLFLKSTQQYETQCILCPSYTIGFEILYVLEMMKSLKSYEESLEKVQSSSGRKSLLLQKGNLKLMRMISNVKFGFVDADPQNFGFNSTTNYQEIQQKRQMLMFEQSIEELLKKNSNQFSQSFVAKLYFKIIDEKSINYALNFLVPIKDKVQNIQLSGCQISEQNFEFLILKVKQKSAKSSLFRSLDQKQLFPTLKHLNLSQNKFTDNIFAVLCRLIDPQKQKSKEKQSNQSSNQIKPLFQALQSINLSKNFISLQSQGSHKNLIIVLENLSSFVLKIDLSFNKLKNLTFFQKCFLEGDVQAGASCSPAQFINLTGNSSISQSQKQSFINHYIEKSKQLDEKFMTDIGFIIDFGEIAFNRDKNLLKYMILVENYLQAQKQDIFFSEINCFGQQMERLTSKYEINPKALDNSYNKNTQISTQKKEITLKLSKSLQYQQKSLQYTFSHKSIHNGSIRSLKNQKNPQLQAKLIQDFSKVFYLKDYKTLSSIKNSLIQEYEINQKQLQKTFSQLLSNKKVQQKKVIDQLEKVVNFVDIKGNNGLKTIQDQKLINQKLDNLVGLIRRKGIQGQGSQLVVYMKYLRDKIIEQFLLNEQNFKKMNLFYDTLKRLKKNYSSNFNKKTEKQKQIFININYMQLSNLPQEELQKRFFDNKYLGLTKMDQSLYDRLRYLLLQNVTLPKILHLSQTLIKELKLFPTRTVRNYNKLITQKQFHIKPFIKAKQKLSSRQINLVTNRMQYLRLYSILHYPFNSKIPSQVSRSGYEGIMGCLNFNQNKQQQALSFIEVVNNFMAFLFYTPETISQQTVTYINYIVNFFNELSLETFEDLQWKQFLIQEFYLHLMNFKPEQKLAKGLLLNVFQYFTGRLICRFEMEKYILAYLLENQPTNLDKSHLVLNNLKFSSSTTLSNQQQKSLRQIQNRQTKISWTIPNQFLVNSFINQGKLMVNIQFDMMGFLQVEKLNEQLLVYVHQTCTVSELVDILLDPNNLYRQKIPLTIKDKLSNNQSLQNLNDCWIFQKINKSDKLQYFRPYESYRYIGEITSQNFQNSQKIIIYLRKITTDQRYHNLSYLSSSIEQIQLLQLFYKIVSNLSMSLELISKLPKQIIFPSYSALGIYSNMEFSSTNFILSVFAQVIHIIYSQKINKIKLQPALNQIDEQSIYQQKQKILQKIIQMLFDRKANQFNDKIVLNCKTLTIQEKLSIRSKVKELIQKQQNQKNLRQKIITFIQSIGDLGYCQTLISQSQIFAINNRFIIQGKLLEHTNESNEIVNIYSKLQNVTFFHQIIDLKLKQQQNSQNLNLMVKKLVFNDSIKQLVVQQKQMKGQSYALLCLYNQIVAVSKNIISFDTQLLYQIQQNGIGKSKNFNASLIEDKTQKRCNPTFMIPQKFINFNITRNKQNESYERISQINSQTTIVKAKNQNIESQQSLNNEKQLIKGSQQEEVFSRKSSKRSLKQNKSKKVFQKEKSQLQANQNNQNDDDNASLIPSRQSIYLHHQQSQNFVASDQKIQQLESKILSQEVELKTQDIIKNMNNQENLLKQTAKPSQSHAQNLETLPIITNQQRKSRRQMPKRRSSRQKDK